jgi:hypothetical protein
MSGQLEKEKGGGRTNTLFKTEIVLRIFGVEVGRPACAGRTYWHLETVDRSRALLARKSYQEFRKSELRDATECSSLNSSTDSPYIVLGLVPVIPAFQVHIVLNAHSPCACQVPASTKLGSRNESSIDHAPLNQLSSSDDTILQFIWYTHSISLAATVIKRGTCKINSIRHSKGGGARTPVKEHTISLIEEPGPS